MEKFEENENINEVVRQIVEKVFEVSPSSIEEIKGKGKNNLVFKVVVDDSPVILRLNNRVETLKLYQKEKWCSDECIKAGIVTPKIIEVGIVEGYAFSFQEFADGVGGNDFANKLDSVWFNLGKSANHINKIPAENLKVDYEKVIEDLFEDNFFVKRGIFSEKLSLKIQERLKETIEWKFLPMLCHGNIHPTNAIIGKDGVTHIIDWETATGNRTPQSELAEIYTWNNGKENIKHFLQGYGLKDQELKDMMRDIQTLVLLRLVQVIVRKVGKNKEWKQDKYVRETSEMLEDIHDYEKDILFTKNL